MVTSLMFLWILYRQGEAVVVISCVAVEFRQVG